jgi:hypothetical protein
MIISYIIHTFIKAQRFLVECVIIQENFYPFYDEKKKAV